MQQLINIAIGLFIIGAIFWLLETLFPAHRQQPKLRSTLKTDLIYWFFTPLVTKVVTRAAVIFVLLIPIALMGKEAFKEMALSGHGPVTQWPLGFQAFGAFVLGDFIGYWMHRWFHGRRLWRFHAVHHSSREVDWLSSVRLHPVNDMIARIAQASALLVIGFPAAVLAVYVPVISFYAILLHANVSWTFGPFRYLVASPAFHRWHHTSEEYGRDKNFAGFFPFWDLLFGTFYMPPGQQPLVFGINNNDVPDGFLGQMIYPFRRKKAIE